MTSGQKRRRPIATAFLALSTAYLLGQSCNNPNQPSFLDPPAGASIATEAVYVSVLVLENESFEVKLTPQGQAEQDVTLEFKLAGIDPSGKEIHHANLDVSAIGTYTLKAIQHVADPAGTFSRSRDFSRVDGAVAELGPLAHGNSEVDGQRVKGALHLGSGATWILLGETRVDASVLAATQASTNDTGPTTGLTLTYHNASPPGQVTEVLGLVAPQAGMPDEEEVWPTAAVEIGSDVYVFYTRVDLDATPIEQGTGLAKATGALLPFSRLDFSPTVDAHFGDGFSLFDGTSFPRIRGVVDDGSHLLLFGQREGLSGLAEDREVVLSRVAPASIEDPAAYEFWTEENGVRAWTSGDDGLVALWSNSSAPSVSWNAHLQRWLAVHTQEDGVLGPYAAEGLRSAIQLRVASDPRGPWSPPETVWSKPPTTSGSEGTSLDALQLAGLDSGSLVYALATDASDPLADPSVELLEFDLAQLSLPTDPIPPDLVDPGAPVQSNPYEVRGYASPGDTVTVYVAGVAQGSDVADGDGLFEVAAVLLDGLNDVHATAERGGLTGPASTTLSVEYQNAVPRTQSGTLLEDTVWTKGSDPGMEGPYLINGTLTIPAGVRLILQPGVELQVDGSPTSILVDGLLEVRGAPGSSVLIGAATPSGPSDWQGIDIRSGGIAIIDELQISNAVTSIDVVSGGDLLLSNSLITAFNVVGVAVNNTGTASIVDTTIDGLQSGSTATGVRLTSAGLVSIQGSTIRNAPRDGIEIDRSSPAVMGNTIELNSRYGIWVRQESDPAITAGNVITANAYGIYVQGVGSSNPENNPAPLVSGNDIFGSSQSDFYATAFGVGSEATVLDASGNWWGTSDPALIVGMIRDASDAANTAVVGFTPFLDQSSTSGGLPVPGGFLNGPVVSGDVTAGIVFTVVGNALIEAGQNVTIPAGAHLRFLPDTRLTAAGRLHVAGAVTQPVLLESAQAQPTSGAWDGIYIEATSSGSLIEHAIIDHAHRAISVAGTAATIRNNVIRDFGRSFEGAGIHLQGSDSLVTQNTIEHLLGHPSAIVYGIFVDDGQTPGGSAPALVANTIQDADDGIRIEGPATAAAASATVSGNTVRQNLRDGIFVTKATSPSITGNLVTANDAHGVNIEGSGVAATSPTPTVNGNDLVGNGGGALGSDLFTSLYGADADTVVIDASENWWGTAVLEEIPDKITSLGEGTDGSTFVTFTPFLGDSIANSGAPVVGNYLSGPTAPGLTATLVPLTKWLAQSRFRAGRHSPSSLARSSASSRGQASLLRASSTIKAVSTRRVW